MGETPAYPFFSFPTLSIVGFVSCCVFAGVLLCVSYTDLRHRIISNKALLLAVVTWVIAMPLMTAITPKIPVSVLISTVLQGLTGAVFLGSFSLISAVIMEKATGKESLGGGDIKLLFVVGLYLGLEKSLQALLIACILVLISAALCQTLKKEWREGIPFAPFIIAGCFIVTLAPVLT